MDSSAQKSTESPRLILNRQQRNYECSQLIKEQYQILRSEIEIKKILEDIDNHMNQLLVEEFQLKSYANANKSNSTKIATTPVIDSKTDTITKTDFDEKQINQQVLNLMFEKSGNDMEEEEDEDDEC